MYLRGILDTGEIQNGCREEKFGHTRRQNIPYMATNVALHVNNFVNINYRSRWSMNFQIICAIWFMLMIAYY